jgi:hypothetical protein
MPTRKNKNLFDIDLGLNGFKQPKKSENPFGIDLGLNTSDQTDKERDTRRTFTKTQKNEILYQQNNRCAGIDCNHKKLDPRAIHYHHIKSWSESGRTITTNGAALCPTCHAISHHKENLKKVDKKPKKTSNDSFGFGGNLFR